MLSDRLNGDMLRTQRRHLALVSVGFGLLGDLDIGEIVSQSTLHIPGDGVDNVTA